MVAKTLYELDTISVPETPFDPSMDLDDRFCNLASIGMTHQSTKTTLAHEPLEVAMENYHLQNSFKSLLLTQNGDEMR